MRAAAVALAALLGAACGRGVRPDDMSAARHRREAQRERLAAERCFESYDAKARRAAIVVPPPWDPAYLGSVFWRDPNHPDLEEARAHAAHAREHDEAADQLEAYEDEQCTGIPDEARGACALLSRVEEVRDVPAGVAIVFEDGVDVRAVAAHLRCHFAWARARGFAPDTACPLDLRDLRLRVAAERTLEVTGPAPAEIRRRAHRMAR